MILWLDDVRKPWQHGYIGVTWAKTADEAITILSTQTVEFASLDHDLADEHYPWADVQPKNYREKTGYDVVLWLEANPDKWPVRGVRIHSANPVGKKRMEQVVYNHYGRLWQ